jgi:hypothetical protein
MPPSPFPSPPWGEGWGEGFRIWVIEIYLRLGAWDLVLPYPDALCPMPYAVTIVLGIPQTLPLGCPRPPPGWHKP